MKQIGCFLLLFIACFSIAQELEAPQISHQSGFYKNEFQVTISHPDPTVTILYTLDGSEPKIENLTGKEWFYKKQYPTNPGDPFGELLRDTIWTYVYSGPLIIKDRTHEKSIISAITTSPIWLAPYYSESNEPFKGTVLRVMAYSYGDTSEIISRTYFVTDKGADRYSMPIVSLAMDNDKMYGYEDGINVPGVDFDEWRVENPLDEIYGFAPANYRRSGSETEFKAHWSFFDKGVEKLNHNLGIRINGNYTRLYPNKSFRLYAKSEYGEKNFKYQFFENSEDNKFKRLVLRNGGNDAPSNVFRDAFIHDLTRNLNYDIQESRPSILFINGEYNGIRNIRERYDKKYFESKYGISEDSLDFFKNIGDVEVGSLEYHNEMFSFFHNNSLKEDINYNKAITYIDLANYTDYLITNIFMGNSDWPHNNYSFFRFRGKDSLSDIKERDGKFRWLLKDLDYGLAMYDDFEVNVLDYAIENPYSLSTSIIFERLLENDNYKKYFCNRFSDILNTSLKQARIHKYLDKYKAIYETEIEENRIRWSDFTPSLSFFEYRLNNIRYFIDIRKDKQRQQLREHFDLQKDQEIVLDVSDTSHGYIHINTIDITSETDGIDEEVYPWSGTYFEGVPVTLTAIPKSGYIFSHWSGMVNDTSSILVLDLDETKYIKANFIPEDDSSVDALTMNEEKLKVYPNPFKDELNVLADYYYGEYFVYSLEGKEVQHGEFNSSKIHLGELPKGMYILKVVANNSVQTVRILKT